MNARSWIKVKTRERSADLHFDKALSPDFGGRPDSPYFLVQDPFNIRMAVVPLFRSHSNGDLEGLGTAFGVSNSGILLTADHVIADYRKRCERINTDKINPYYSSPEGERLIAFLSPGMVLGIAGVGPQYFPTIISARTPVKQRSDPMLELLGKIENESADVTVLETEKLNAELHTFQLSFSTTRPKVGDRVVAVGYPKIDTIRENKFRATQMISEGMFASYGTVTRLHPGGRDLANETPVFEVSANWPSGMSGGPVFNINGEVIGIVSRSLEATDLHPGVGWATWLGHLPEVGQILAGLS